MLRNMAGFAVAVLVIPIALVVKLIVAPFERPIECSPDEVLRYLRDFHDGTGDDYDWDAFTSIPIADAELEEVRVTAALLDPPLAGEELSSLRALIARVEAIVQRHHPA